jgi:hypothetical protein
MITETCQILSTAHRVLDGLEYIDSSSGRKIKRWNLEDETLNALLYKATHINHPSTMWARQSLANYTWLTSLLSELSKEYTFRYGKIHKCERIGLIKMFKFLIPSNIKNDSFTQPVLAMPEKYRSNDAVKSYQRYYIGDKKHLFFWKNREIPKFIEELI